MIRPASAGALLLAACSPAGLPPVQERHAVGGQCRPEGLDRFVGQTASAAVGAELLAVSGARTIRWVAPGMAVTMDFSPQRLTVSYDQAMRIEQLACG